MFADVVYDYEKGRIPSNERLEYLLELGLKDLLSEILRFSAQSLEKKISQLSLQLKTHLQNITTNDNNTLQNKDFNLYLNSTLLQKTKLKILQRVIKTAKSFNKTKQNVFKSTLEEDFKEGFLEFIASLIHQSNVLEGKYIAYFEGILDVAQEQLELDLKSKENVLQNALNHLHTNTAQQRGEILSQAFRFLQVQMAECQMLQHYATREE